MKAYKIESIYVVPDSHCYFREFEITPERIGSGNTCLSFTERETTAVLLREEKYSVLDEAIRNHPSATIFRHEDMNPLKVCDCGHSIDAHDHARENFGGCVAPCLVPECECRKFYYDWEEWTEYDAQDI